MPAVAPLSAIWLLALTVAATAETAADRFSPKRGLNLETWMTWPDIEPMARHPETLAVFPEWRRYVPDAALASLAPLGFDHVRMPIEPAPFLRLGPGAAQDALIAQVVQTTELLQAHGLNVIVDLHTIPRPGEPWGVDALVSDPALFDAYAILVGRIATALRPLGPDRTALELMNEPTNDCGLADRPDQQQWPAQLKRLHDVARTAAPAMPLIAPGGCWGSAEGLIGIDPSALADDNVIWTFHSYDPFLFTHQGAGWTQGPQLHFADVPFPPAAIDDRMADALVAEAIARAKAANDDSVTEADLRAELQAYRDLPADAATKDITGVAAWADAHGVPRNRVYIGEFGVIFTAHDGRPVPEESRAAFLDTKITAMEAAEFGWGVYSWTGTLAIADPETYVPFRGLCAALRLTSC